MIDHPLLTRANANKNERAAEVLTHRDGSNRSSTCQRGETMADESQYPDSVGKSNPEQNDTWKPVGALAAALALAAAKRAGAK